jgi:hypothetical protein
VAESTSDQRPLIPARLRHKQRNDGHDSCDLCGFTINAINRQQYLHRNWSVRQHINFRLVQYTSSSAMPLTFGWPRYNHVHVSRASGTEKLEALTTCVLCLLPKGAGPIRFEHNLRQPKTMDPNSRLVSALSNCMQCRCARCTVAETPRCVAELCLSANHKIQSHFLTVSLSRSNYETNDI